VNSQPVPNFDAIIGLERSDVDQLREMSMGERSELFAAACRAATRIEASRIAMGLPPSEPAPWPVSTWVYLGECARRVREQ
jgi:hypothetical protein